VSGFHINESEKPKIEDGDLLLHGWDAQFHCWHEPVALARSRRPPGSARLRTALRTARSTFQGAIRCSVPGLPCVEFGTAIYDLNDTGLAIVHSDGAAGGTVGILVVVPHARRELLREDFALQILTLVGLLGSPVNQGCELDIHDYIEENLRHETTATQVFALETAALTCDAGILLSAHFESLCAAIPEWLAARESREEAPAAALVS